MTNKIKILHIEDEPADALLISHSLKKRKLDSEIVVADSKKSFLLALDDFDPDIILADHSLPSFNSFEALELIQKSGKQVPLILVTATMTDEFAVDIIKKGAKDYVLKDRLERLPSAIENVLKTRYLEIEREEFLKQLERNERKFRRLIENAAGAVTILSANGSPTYVSPSVKNVLGYTEKEALEIDLIDIIHSDHRTCFLNRLEECRAVPDKPFYGDAVRVLHKDGDFRWLETTLTNLLHDSAVFGFVVDFRDVTERKDAEKALKDSEEKYRAFFENSRDGILLTMTNGRILAANDAACKMFRRTEQEICAVGRDGVVDLSDPRLAEALEERQRTGKILVELNMVRKDGSIFPAALSSSVFHNENGEETTAVIIRDSSDVKRAEEKLKVSEEKYRQLFENSPLPHILYDVNTLELVDVNQFATEHYGYSRKEFLNLKILDLLPQEEIQRFVNLKQDLDDELIDLRQSAVQHLRKDGSRITVETFGYRLSYKGRECGLAICLDVTEKNEYLERLKEKTEKLGNAEKLAKLGYWEVDLRDPKFFWSDEVYRIWGRKKEDFQVDPEVFEQTIHPDDLEQFKKVQVEAIKGIRDLDNEHRILLPNGEIKWVYENGKVIRDEHGQALRFEGSVQDITDRKIAMQKLQQSEARHKGIIQSQTNYVIRISIEGKYSYVNNKFQEDFGWIHTDNKIIGKFSLLSIKEYHHERVLEISKKCMENPDQIFQVELDKPAKNGGTRTTLWDFIYLKASQDDPGEIQCIGIDITARVHAEKEIRFQSNLLDKIGQAVIAVDDEGIINYWNKAATTIYGWLPEDMIGTQVLDQASVNTAAPQALEIIEMLKSGETWSGELIVSRKDGTEFPALVNSTPIYDTNQNFKGYIAVSSDNTERKKADIKLRELNKNLRNYTRELVAANKGLEQFTFIVSHNLRAPVANIIGLGDLLKEETYPAEAKEKFQKELLENTKRLDNVVQDLNTILHVKTELNAEKTNVRLDKLVSSIKGGISNMIQENNVEVKTNFKEVPVIETVQTYLHSIFYNLISNSIKYRHPERKPELYIESKREENKTILTFRDNGLGFDVSKRGDQVFGLYKRFHHHIEGKGMGLFMVKTQVELLGGKISVDSVINKGSEFKIELKDKLKDEYKNGKDAAIYSS